MPSRDVTRMISLRFLKASPESVSIPCLSREARDHANGSSRESVQRNAHALGVFTNDPWLMCTDPRG